MKGKGELLDLVLLYSGDDAVQPAQDFRDFTLDIGLVLECLGECRDALAPAKDMHGIVPRILTAADFAKLCFKPVAEQGHDLVGLVS